MVSWASFEAAAPEMAAAGRRMFDRRGTGEALLGTVRGDEPPRIHPINLAIVGEGLFAFILASAKRRDLELDGRYALHAHQDPTAPSEFALRGHARRIEDPGVRSTVGSAWSFEVDDSYTLFEFSIESALLGVRAGPDAWPPRYTTWRVTGPPASRS
jgi:dipeptidyl aminopeptidase/acylaminoacyl peptidase